MNDLILAFVVATIGYAVCEIHDRWKARKRYERFHARCQQRLAELVAVDRDTYDGRPV